MATVANQPLAISEEQLQTILGSIDALKSGWIHWDVFLSALLAMLVGIALEYLKRYYEKQKADATQRRDELKQVNIATIVLKYNLEILIHFAHQIILPHYRDTAYNAGSNVGPSKEEIDKFVQTLNKYQHMMMKGINLKLRGL